VVVVLTLGPSTAEDIRATEAPANADDVVCPATEDILTGTLAEFDFEVRLLVAVVVWTELNLWTAGVDGRGLETEECDSVEPSDLGDNIGD